MCGIAGVMTFDAADRAAVEGAVRRMLGKLRHRGPDDEGMWTTVTNEGHVVSLGHARLSIIDLTSAGRQPMSRGSATVTYNGEIYNYKSLRSELAQGGAPHTSQSDTEVLLKSYARWGNSAVEHLDGMFAFALWDGASQQLVMARDRFGIKPLYYHVSPHRVVFASEIRALLESGLVSRKLQPESLWHYFGYQTTPTPMTLVDGVRMLEPGSIAQVGVRGTFSQRKYWDLLEAASAESRAESPAAARARVTDLLNNAVTSHLVSDVPVGMFLSGGIDSGSILSALSSSGIRASTFTVSLDDHGLDESDLASMMAAEFGAEHRRVRLRESDVLALVPDALEAVDHPTGDGFNTFVVSRAVSERGLKVALSGLGGDEVFGGYPSFGRLSRLSRSARHLVRSPRAVRRVAARVVRAAGGGTVTAEKTAAVIETRGTIAETWPITRQLFSAAARRSMLAPREVPNQFPDAYAPALSAALERHPDASVWQSVSFAESSAYMHDVLLRDVDQMSMSHSLEVRVPLLDHRLAAFAVAQPDEWKRDGLVSKPLLARSLTRPLPEPILRKRKQGFVLPFDTWMRGKLSPLCERQLGPRGLDGRGLLKSGEAERLWRRFLHGAPGVTWGRVWSLVSLNAWLERQGL